MKLIFVTFNIMCRFLNDFQLCEIIQGFSVTKADFSVSKANRKSVHFPSYWILALASTLHRPLSVVSVFAFHLGGKRLSALSFKPHFDTQVFGFYQS